MRIAKANKNVKHKVLMIMIVLVKRPQLQTLKWDNVSAIKTGLRDRGNMIALSIFQKSHIMNITKDIVMAPHMFKKLLIKTIATLIEE